jgi:hypothetical protein
MTLADLLHSLSDAERDFIAGLDYGADREAHRTALDAVIEHDGDVDCDTQGFWYPYEVIELGKNWLQEGHEREYAACMSVVLLNMEAGRDRCNDLEDILTQHYSSIQSLPDDLREIIDSFIERTIEKSEPSVAPNGGPATQLGNSGVTEGPPSAS